MESEVLWNLDIPCNVLLAGPSGCGKSTLVLDLLKDQRLLGGPVDKICLCYGIWTSFADEISKMPNVLLYQGIPEWLNEPTSVLNPKDRNVLIFDDLGNELGESKLYTSVLTRVSHHVSALVLTLDQVIFAPQAERRKQSQQYHVYFLFRNPRCMGQIGVLSRQFGICNPKTMQAAYRSCTSMDNPFGFLVVDTRQSVPNELRLLSNIKPCDYPPNVYLDP